MTKPIASLGALLTALTDVVAASEQRILVRIADHVTDLENRLVGLEDKVTELSAHLDEVKDALHDQIEEVQGSVARIDVDAVAGDIRGDLDTLADAERRRELAEIRQSIRRVS